MYYEGVLEGHYVDLKSITEDDAEFTRDIRRNPDFSAFFPKFDNTLEQQKEWIRSQQNKEGDYFFVIWDKKGNRIGTIGMYNVKDEECEAGRLAAVGNAFQSLEAQMLSFGFAFDVLGMKKVVSYIFADNERALRFSKQFGGDFEPPKAYVVGERPMIKKTTRKEQFVEAAKSIKRMIYR